MALSLIAIMPAGINGSWISSNRVCQLRSKFHSGVVCRLNRFLFDESEISRESSDDVTVTLPIDDYRTIHAAKILNLRNGDAIRCGVVSNENHDGLITDKATIQWLPEGKVKKAEPLGNGLPPGSLQVSLTNLVSVDEVLAKPPVSLILALPRPLALGRMLPMISQMGVETLVLTEARKVPKDYFGSHLFRPPLTELTDLLIEGLSQSGDVQLPKVIITRNLSKFLNNELNELFPVNEYARAIAHPLRKSDDRMVKLRDVSFPCAANRRLLIAVGPEGGWEEPDELNHFVDHGFVQVSMGNRVLRSDCAVVSLLALAHDLCN